MRGHVVDERFCGNYVTREVHDLSKEKAECQLTDVIEKGDDIPFETLEVAHKVGYRNCKHCLG